MDYILSYFIVPRRTVCLKKEAESPSPIKKESKDRASKIARRPFDIWKLMYA